MLVNNPGIPAKIITPVYIHVYLKAVHGQAVHGQHHRKYGNNIKGLTTVVYQQITDLQQNKYLKDFLPQTEIHVLKNLLNF